MEMTQTSKFIAALKRAGLLNFINKPGQFNTRLIRACSSRVSNGIKEIKVKYSKAKQREGYYDSRMREPHKSFRTGDVHTHIIMGMNVTPKTSPRRTFLPCISGEYLYISETCGGRNKHGT